MQVETVGLHRRALSDLETYLLYHKIILAFNPHRLSTARCRVYQVTAPYKLGHGATILAALHAAGFEVPE